MGGTRQMWKVRLMVCLAVVNRLKIRMKNMDSEVFLFSSSKEIKTDRKKNILQPIHIMQMLTLDAQIILATSYFIFPVIFSLL